MTTTLALPETTALITGALYTDSHLTSEHSREQYRSNLEAFEAWRAGQPLTRPAPDQDPGRGLRRPLAA